MSEKALVIGASTKETRYSNKAIKALRRHGYLVEAIGARPGKVGDVEFGKTQEAFKNIDTVTLYLNPKRQKAYYDYIISLHPKRVIFNPGTENEKFYPLLAANNIHCEIACTLVLLSTDQY